MTTAERVHRTICKHSGCRFSRWRGPWCYTHWRESQGYVFDSVQGRFVKAVELSSRTACSASQQEQHSSLAPRKSQSESVTNAVQ